MVEPIGSASEARAIGLELRSLQRGDHMLTMVVVTVNAASGL